MAPWNLRNWHSALLAIALLVTTSCTDHSGGLFAPDEAGAISTGGTSHTSINPGSAPSAPNSGSNDSGSSNGNTGNSAEPVPEPGTMLLFGAGLTTLAFYRRRRRADADVLPA